NVEKVQEHLVEEEIETMVEGTENVDDDEFMDEIFIDQEDPGTRLEPGSHKESPDVNKNADILIINDNDEEKESVGDELIRRKDAIKSTMKKVIPSMVDNKLNKIAKKLVSFYVAEGLLLDKQNAQTNIVSLVAKVVQKEREILQAELSMQVTNVVANIVPSQIKDDEQVRNADLSIWWSLKIEFEKHAPPVAPSRLDVVRTRDHEDHHHDDARPEEESSAKRQKTFDHGTYSLGESSYEQVMEELNPSGSEVSPELLKEISGKVDEAQLQKVMNEMLRESKKENLTLQIPKKPALVYQSYERDPKAPPMTLLNQDLFYLKRQEHKRDNPDEVCSESKIVEVVRTLYDLGHECKYITNIVVRRADGKFGAFSKSDYKYLYKNDIEDLYLIVHDYQLGMESYQQKVNRAAPTITFPGIERTKVITVTSKQVVGLIYENNKKKKKKKRVMIIKEIPKFCDATLKRVLELVENKNMDVKHGYEYPKLIDNDAEYLRRIKNKDAEVSDAGVSFRWQPDEKTLLAKCYVAVSENRNVGRSQAKDTFCSFTQEDAWDLLRKHAKWDTPPPAPVDLTENEEIPAVNTDELFGPDARPRPPGKERPEKKTKSDTSDMLSSKWNTLNHNCQKFNAIYKRCSRLTKSGENELDVMKQARAAYRDENKNSSFTQEDAWDLLRKHAKWDAPPPAPVDLTENEEIPAVNTDELFGPDARPRPPGKERPEKKTKSDTSVSTGGSPSSQFEDIMTKELRLKQEAAEAAFEILKEKERTVMRLEEMKFLAISTKYLPEDGSYFIEEQKEAIRAKYNLYRNRGSNPGGSRQSECNLFNPPRNTNREKDNGEIAAKNGIQPMKIARGNSVAPFAMADHFLPTFPNSCDCCPRKIFVTCTISSPWS
nr:glutathione S-transferase T3-like [Tanacetum cinerariifolium]